MIYSAASDDDEPHIEARSSPDVDDSYDADLTCTPDPSKTVTYSMHHGPGSAGKTYGSATATYSKHLKTNWNPWEPFLNADDFQLGKFMLDRGWTKAEIDEYLNIGLDHDRTESFNNADELWCLLENAEFGFGAYSWTEHQIGQSSLYCRDILSCVQLLLRHLPFTQHMSYEPVRLYDSSGNRCYNEIWSANW